MIFEQYQQGIDMALFRFDNVAERTHIAKFFQDPTIGGAGLVFALQRFGQYFGQVLCPSSGLSECLIQLCTFVCGDNMRWRIASSPLWYSSLSDCS